MLSAEGQAILDSLAVVAAERRRRAGDPPLAERVAALKHYQHGRLTQSYADLLASPRFGAAARFFLDDLYGPHDFTERDQQFARVVPGLVRLFPHELVLTVVALGELHALSESLDTRMAANLLTPQLSCEAYQQAWKLSATPAERERQIRLMLDVGTALDRYTRNALLRHTLKLMRGPARAAGLGSLQAFLESGFDTFKAMRGATEFLSMIAMRERQLFAALFELPVGDPALLSQLPAKV